MMIGGTLPLPGCGATVGQGTPSSWRAARYCNSFLSFFPTVAVILNIEADHLDFFQDPGGRGALLPHFADLVPRKRSYHRQPGRRQHH